MASKNHEHDDDEDLDYASMVQFVADTNKTTFIHVFLFNSLVKGNINEGLNRLCSLHYALLCYQAFLALLQFVGLLFVANSNQSDNLRTLFVVVAFLGFLTSISGVGISFIAVEYFHGIRGENIKFIVHGVLEYWFSFYVSDLLGMLGSALFVLEGMVLIHRSLIHWWIALPLDCIAVIVMVTLYLLHKKIIVNPQRYEANSHVFRRQIVKQRIEDSKKK